MTLANLCKMCNVSVSEIVEHYSEELGGKNDLQKRRNLENWHKNKPKVVEAMIKYYEIRSCVNS